MNTILERLQQTKREVVARGATVCTPASDEGRMLSTSEQHAYDKITTELDVLDARIAEVRGTEERAGAAERVLRDSRGHGPGVSDADLDAEFRTAIRENSRKPIEARNANRRSGYSPGLEQRVLVTTSGGGLTPTSFYDQIVRHMVESSAVLAAGATLLETETGEPLKVPKSTAFSTAAIVPENSVIGVSDPTLASVTLGAFKYGYFSQVSTELATDSNFDLLGFLAEQTGTAVGVAAGAHFITGTGTGQPRGIVTDATVGKTGGTAVAGAFTGDDLIDLMHSVAEPYARQPATGWLMRNSTVGAARKLKASGTGEYLFDIAVPEGSGAVGTLLGRPVFVDPTVAAIGLSAKSVIFGDFSKYWVRAAGALRFERSDDFAFQNDLASFRGLARLDGALIDTTGAIKVFAGGAT